MMRSGGECVRMRLFIDRDRFKAIIAGAAEPEERRAAWTALDPIRSRDRLAALGTGISAGQIGIGSSHGASPSTSDVITTPRFFKMSLNATGLLSKRMGFSRASSLHLDCDFCTTFLRVRMTHFASTEAMHRTYNVRIALAAFVDTCMSRRHLAAISSGFRHILAR